MGDSSTMIAVWGGIRGAAMSKLIKIFASVALMVVVFSAAAEARGGHSGHHGGGWHGGGGFRGGIGWGWGGYPYGYYPGPYYYAPACGWVPVRVWRRGHWVIRSVWRCW
jgi:hypothetical protein